MSAEPPYLRIAAEIRRRITVGELSPGDLVPSTRAITREWGVAMATATKALAALRQEGLVRAVPGVGTAVAEASEAPRGQALTRERIVAAAVALADAEGLASVSMRRLASELSTSTMALYRHVPGKVELVRLMTDLAFGEDPLGPVPPHWRPGLALAARKLWAMYRRHPWMAHAMGGFTRPVATPQAMRYTEWVLGVLKGTGLSLHDMVHTHLTLFAYVQGLAVTVESEDRAVQDTGMSGDEWMARNEPQFEAIASGGTYPLLNSMFEQDEFELDIGALFEFGLRRTLDGVGAMLGNAR
ncbi:MAG TPA: TetR/AcrR family transcriptional regulator C-terminal domain-containing protein [Streptomyces sp.]|nr:TetR/AcrR family transcriptional regulator C-terminal domain-containing protein [Streptomyces sp.]